MQDQTLGSEVDVDALTEIEASAELDRLAEIIAYHNAALSR